MRYLLLLVFFLSCFVNVEADVGIMNEVIIGDEFYKSGNLKKGNITFSDGESMEGTFYDTCSGGPKEGKRIYPYGDIEIGKFDIEGSLKEGKRISLNEVIDGEFIAGIFKKGNVTFLDGEVQNGNFDINGMLEKGYISYPNGTILCVNTQVKKELKEKDDEITTLKKEKHILNVIKNEYIMMYMIEMNIIIIIIFSILGYYCVKYFYKNKIENKNKKIVTLEEKLKKENKKIVTFEKQLKELREKNKNENKKYEIKIEKLKFELDDANKKIEELKKENEFKKINENKTINLHQPNIVEVNKQESSIQRQKRKAAAKASKKNEKL